MTLASSQQPVGLYLGLQLNFLLSVEDLSCLQDRELEPCLLRRLQVWKQMQV